LNVGAGVSTSIEDQLSRPTDRFVVDRLDVEDPSVAHPRAGASWTASLEAMADVPSECYDVVFANYVLEHVSDPTAAASELHRVLRRGGVLVLAVPNPRAPEFRISAVTPLWFHRLVRRGRAWKPFYAYGDLTDLTQHLSRAGFSTPRVNQFSFIEGYLGRFPLLRVPAAAYDAIVTRYGLISLMGDACVVANRA
jgi:SAM-dependent methyltransferase